MTAFFIIVAFAAAGLIDEFCGRPLARWADEVYTYLGEGRRIDRELDRQERIRACLAQHPSGKDVA